jgi:hypothetical protein
MTSGAQNSGTAGSGAQSSGTPAPGTAAALGVRGGAAGEGTGMNAWGQPSPCHSSSTSASTSASRWSAAARADSYSSEEEELALDEEDEEDEQEHEEEHERPPNHDWIDACLRSTSSTSSSSSSSSTLPSPFRTDLPPASTADFAPTTALGSIETTTSATPAITTTEGAPRRRAPMRCKTPGCDGSGSTKPYKLTHCSMRCCPRRATSRHLEKISHSQAFLNKS